MTCHSPGPWEQHERSPDGYVMSSDWMLVAYTRLTGDPDTNEANARLIAAAPELLQALKCLLRDTQHADHTDCDEWCPVMMARAAIAKAENET